MSYNVRKSTFETNLKKYYNAESNVLSSIAGTSFEEKTGTVHSHFNIFSQLQSTYYHGLYLLSL